MIMVALDDCSDDPAGVGEDEGEEQIRMNLISEAPHLSAR